MSVELEGPVRIQLKRTKGWRLQEASRAINGLDAVKVDRTTRWGNHIVVGEEQGVGYAPWTAAEAVAAYREDTEYAMETDRPDGAEPLDLSPLRGKNLACWCKPGEPCHADVLLELANETARQFLQEPKP